MNSHHGQLIEYTIRKNGYSLTEMAAKLNVNRRTIYNWFQLSDLKLSIIIAIGNILRHDFSKELPDLVKKEDFNFDAPVTRYSLNSNNDEWIDKYLALLENHNKLLAALLAEKDAKSVA